MDGHYCFYVYYPQFKTIFLAGIAWRGYTFFPGHGYYLIKVFLARHYRMYEALLASHPCTLVRNSAAQTPAAR